MTNTGGGSNEAELPEEVALLPLPESCYVIMEDDDMWFDEDGAMRAAFALTGAEINECLFQ